MMYHEKTEAVNFAICGGSDSNEDFFYAGQVVNYSSRLKRYSPPLLLSVNKAIC
jgi:hypothetical protein